LLFKYHDNFSKGLLYLFSSDCLYKSDVNKIVTASSSENKLYKIQCALIKKLEPHYWLGASLGAPISESALVVLKKYLEKV